MSTQELTPEAKTGAICKTCKGDMLHVDGCEPFILIHGCKQYSRVKVGDAGDMYENGNADTRCTDCGARYGHYHHYGCDCENCPVCDDQLIFCDCDLRVIHKKRRAKR